MGKLDFCPYDGKQINYENLAYEIIHPMSWTWTRIKEETIMGTSMKTYIDEQDQKRDHFYGRVSAKKPIIVLSNKSSCGKSGFQLLKEYIQNGGCAGREKKKWNDYTTDMSDIYTTKVPLPPYMRAESTVMEDATFGSKGPIKLHHSINQGIDTFCDENDDPVFYVIPCCPFCHNRLPFGWNAADDFVGISMIGDSGAGKTSYVYSLLYTFGKRIRYNKLPDGTSLIIKPAYYTEMDQDYDHLFAKAEKMCQNQGECPQATSYNHALEPLFFHIQYRDMEGSRTWIMGLYDDGSDLLTQHKAVIQESAERLRSRMYADMFFYDPRKTKSLHLKENKVSGRVKFTSCKMLTMEEQIRFQQQNQHKVIAASEILNRSKTTGITKKYTQNKTDIYTQRLCYYQMYGTEDCMKRRRFIGVISKSDLLEKKDSMKESYEELFCRETYTGYIDTQKIIQRSNMTMDFIRKYKMIGDRDPMDIQNDYKGGVSWHCISALGCDAFTEDHLMGDYSPIHVDDPIINCIRNIIIENRGTYEVYKRVD